MPKIDKNKSEEQRLAEIHAANDRTAAYRLRDLASSFKYLSRDTQKAFEQALETAHVEEALRNLAEAIED